MMLLNTDWPCPGNIKNVTVRAGEWSFAVPVREREALWVRIYENRAIVSDASLHLQCAPDSRLTAYGRERASYTIHTRTGAVSHGELDFGRDTELPFPPERDGGTK